MVLTASGFSLLAMYRTRALLGIRAREIHVCGGLEVLELVRKLLVETGDEFHEVKYQRLSKLQ